MRTSKKIITICLAIMLCLGAVMPTFSWYGTSESSGNSVNLNKTVPGADFVNTTTTTYGSTIVKKNIIYDTKPTTDTFGGTLTAGSSAYYKTVITNSTSTDAKVNLFLGDVTLSGGNEADLSKNFYVGSISPIYNKQAYYPRSSSEKADYPTARIYFQPKGNWSGKNYYIFYYAAITSRKGIKMDKTPYTPDNVTYYADIPATATGFFISSENDEDKDGNARTAHIDIQGIPRVDGCVIGLTGETGDYNNMVYEIYKPIPVCNVKEYYNAIHGNVGYDGASVATVNGTDYTGASVTYTSDNESVVSVSSNGSLTFLSEGSATITTTITGYYKDTMQTKTNVYVTDAMRQVPVVESVVVPANGSAEVCWFVRNESSTDITYEISGVDTSL